MPIDIGRGRGEDAPVTCPCGVGESLEACCGPFLAGDAVPETAEALMRSRYAAYTQQAMDYIADTHDPNNRDDLDREGAENWAKESTWLGLDIVNTEAGGAGDTEGVVEFVARYRLGGQDCAHHERSRFSKIDSRWYYIDGDMIKAKPVTRDAPKVGRNEPCPCGSGKKSKKCCGAN